MSHKSTVFEFPTEITAKVAEIMDRRRGFAPGLDMMTQGAPEGGGNQQGQQGGGQQQGGQQGQQGSGDGGQQQGLLDQESQQQQDDGQQGGNGGGQQGSGGSGQQQGGQQQGGFDEERFMQRITSEIDRRVNGVIQSVDRRLGGGGSGGSQQDGSQQQGSGGNGGGQQQGGGQGGGQQSQQHGPTVGDQREARLVYREFVGGGDFKFLGNEERDHGALLARSIIAERLAAGDDPEQAGRAAADKVETTLRGLRKHYEDRTIAALKRTGRLVEGGPGSGQALPGGTAPGAGSGFAAGQSKAQSLLGDRLPQNQQGQQNQS